MGIESHRNSWNLPERSVCSNTRQGVLHHNRLSFSCERKRTVLNHRGRMVVGNPQGSHTTEGSALLENMFSNLLSIANRQARDRETERKDTGNQQSTGTGLHLSKASRSFKNPTRVFQIFCLIAVRFFPPANRKEKKKKQARELKPCPLPLSKNNGWSWRSWNWTNTPSPA